MNKAILIALAAFTALAAVSQIMPIAQTRFLGVQDEREAAFTQWMMKQGKSYGTSTEKEFRLATFKVNYDFITKTNASQNKYWLELNKFADMTKEELANFRGLKNKPVAKKLDKVQEILTYPASIDQREYGVVSGVKNQGQCGSCWAFSTTGSIEGFQAQQSGYMETYSEQQLVDCAGSYGTNGCGGGLMTAGLQYVIDNGITTEYNYPYQAQNGYCQYNGGGYRFNQYANTQVSVDGLKTGVSIRPVSVGVDAQNWSFYGGGVFYDCGESIDHGVLAVGYTEDYWIVKNSWGGDWGESGYIRLSMGNTCAILNNGSLPYA